jgi:hypothetical protein
VDYDDSDFCICGHQFEAHDCNEDGICVECLFSDGTYGNGTDECEKFQLDNLKYIENKAKEQGLI